jgi:hypothetical protein
MTPPFERLGLVAAGALAGALSTFIVMRLVFTPAPLAPPPPPVVQVADAVAPAPAPEVQPVDPPAPAETPPPVDPPAPRVARAPAEAPPPAPEPPAATGNLAVIATSSGVTQAPIFVDSVEKRAGRHREAVPAGTYQVKVVCPKDSPSPGWAPVKSIVIEAGDDAGLRIDCDNKTIEPF